MLITILLFDIGISVFDVTILLNIRFLTINQTAATFQHSTGEVTFHSHWLFKGT